MSSLPTQSPAYGINPNTLLSSVPIISTPITSEIPNGFARLVRLMQSNERLFAEQRALAVKLQLQRARAYLADPNANPSLERANLRHLKTKYSGILALLRANRREAQALGARLDSKPRGEGEPCPAQADPSSVLIV
jgi:hypothetical protein